MSGRVRTSRAVLAIASAVAGLLLLATGQSLGQDERTVLVTEVVGPITPVVAAHLEDAVDAGVADGHDAVVVRMDTPGGLGDSMRTIAQTFLTADVPVVVWVAPAGAGAASAGYVIATSAHVFAMAPATNTGSATPIGMEGGEVIDKVIEDFVEYTKEIADHRGRDTEFAEDAVRDGRSVGATEAVEIGVADLIAADLTTLLDDIDGTAVAMGTDDEVTLSTAGAAPVDFDMSWTRRILQALANPNLAFIFFALAPLAILWEIANPGMGLGAIAGAIMLILALYSLAVLPVNLAGLALLAIAIVLFIVEAFVPGVGVAAGGGAVALVLAGLFMFQRPTGIGVDWWVIAPTAVFTMLIAVGLAVLVRRTWAQRPTTGEEAYSGARAEVRTWDVETGQVFFDGALWRARTTGPEFEPGETVRVVDRDGLELTVEPYRDEVRAVDGAGDDEPAPGPAAGAGPAPRTDRAPTDSTAPDARPTTEREPERQEGS